MFDGPYSRRRLLRRGLATAGAGTLLGVAGCSGLNPLGGGGAGVYADWLAVPDDVGDSDHYQFTHLNTEAIEASEDELPDEFDVSFFESTWDPVDVDWEDTSTILFYQSITVVEAEFTREDVVDDLEDEDYDDDTEHLGYTIYLGPNEVRALAVGDSTLVVVSGAYQSDPVDTLEAVLDAENGDEERYGDDSEDMATLTGELGAGSVVTGRTLEEVDNDNPDNGRFDHMVARGSSTTIDGDTAQRKWVVVYDEASDVDLDDLEDWVDENDGSGGTFDDVDDVSYNASGRAGIITGTSDTDDL